MSSIAAKALEDAARAESLMASTVVEKPLPLELPHRPQQLRVIAQLQPRMAKPALQL